MSPASCLQATDFSPLNSCLSNGFSSRGWTCEFKVMAQKPLFLAKFYWVFIFYIWYLSLPLLSSPFYPQPHPLGVLSNACHIFLFSFTLWALPKLFSSPILINVIFSFVHPHSSSTLSISSPCPPSNSPSPQGEREDTTNMIFLVWGFNFLSSDLASISSHTAGEASFSNPFHWKGATGSLLSNCSFLWRAERTLLLTTEAGLGDSRACSLLDSSLDLFWLNFSTSSSALSWYRRPCVMVVWCCTHRIWYCFPYHVPGRWTRWCSRTWFYNDYRFSPSCDLCLWPCIPVFPVRIIILTGLSHCVSPFHLAPWIFCQSLTLSLLNATFLSSVRYRAAPTQSSSSIFLIAVVPYLSSSWSPVSAVWWSCLCAWAVLSEPGSSATATSPPWFSMPF